MEIRNKYAGDFARLADIVAENDLDRLVRKHNDELAGAIAVFNQKRPELEALFNRDELPYPKDRERALKYIEGFYDTINDPKKLEKKILGNCR